MQSGGATGKTVLTITGEVLPAEKSFGEMYPVRAGDLMLAWRNVNLGYVPRGGVKSTAIEYYNPTRQPLTLSPEAGSLISISLCRNSGSLRARRA